MITNDLKRFFSEITDLIPLERKIVSLLMVCAAILNLSFYVLTSHKDDKAMVFVPVEAPEYHYKSNGESSGFYQDSKSNQSAKLFNFDPNVVSFEELLRLGFSEKVAHIFLNYRNKGGRFYKKEDVQKIYGVSDKLYHALEPYILIGNSPNNENQKKYADHKEPETLDINQASPMEYEKLKGIGKGFAYKICNFRDKLGGFVSIDQVGETYGLSDSVFQQIKPILRLQNPVPKKINLNTASVEAMDAHPYIAKWQAEDIVNNRPIKDLDHLFTLKSFKKKDYNQRLIPYITF